MCDWITASVVSLTAKNKEAEGFDTGRFMKVNRYGVLETEFASRFSSPGSYDSSLSFRAPYPYQLEMSGNPVKFLQGHNLFGSDDFTNLFFSAGAVTAINSGSPFPVPLSLHELLWNDDGTKPARHELTDFRPTRIDLTRSYRFENNETARAWLRTVGASGHSRHKNNLRNDGTIYFGQTSSRWSFKMYHKYDELTSKKKGHELSNKLTGKAIKDLTDWSAGVVRFELTLRRKEIEKLPLDFNSLEIWKEYYSKIQFNNNSEVLDMNQLIDIKPKMKIVYALWKSGADLRSMYSKNTFYTHRRYFLEIGIDIAVPPTKEQSESSLKLEEIRWDPEPIQELLVNDFGSISKTSYGF